MKKFIFSALLGLFLLGCLQTENSNSQDEGLVVETPDDATSEFIAARAVITANCASCHNYHTQTEDELIDSGIVTAGDAEGSTLFFRLQGSTGSSGPKNMPTSGGALVDSDLQIIFDWIEGIE